MVYYAAMDFSVAHFSALFLAPTCVVGVLAAVHATRYLHGEELRRAPWFWFYFAGTLLAMVGVVLSPNMLLFLLAWEAMGLFSSGLVGFESESKASRLATWIYLLACHAGAVCLILAGVMAMRPEPCWPAVWYLALVGFGLKIGFPPFHVWLPEAHPAAPASASAVMSGAMIPLGFYGLLAFFVVGPMHLSVPATVLPHMGWSLLVLGSAAALGSSPLAPRRMSSGRGRRVDRLAGGEPGGPLLSPARTHPAQGGTLGRPFGLLWRKDCVNQTHSGSLLPQGGAL